MLAIRLSRIGHENLQKFRLIVQEKTCSPKSGKVVAIVGNYDPTDPENKLTFDAEKVETFLKNGAEPSDTVARLLLKNGFKKELVEKFVVQYTKQKSKKAAKEEKPAEGEEAQASGEGEAPAAEGDAAPAESTDQAAEAEKKEDTSKPEADEQPAAEESKKEESSDKTPTEKPDKKPADEDKTGAEEKK